MDLGANPTRTFLRVTLPADHPGDPRRVPAVVRPVDRRLHHHVLRLGAEHHDVPGADLRPVAHRDPAADQRARVDDPVRQHHRARGRHLVGSAPRAPPEQGDLTRQRNAMRTVQHWIDGKPWDGAPGAHRRRVRPVDGRGAGAGRARGPGGDRRRGARARARRSRDWRDVALAPAGRGSCSRSARCSSDARTSSPRPSAPSTARSCRDALGEVGRGQEVVEFACGIPHLLKGGYSESVSTGTDVHSIRQPLGVVAGITPFNFPAMVPDVDVPGRDRVRERVRAQAERSRSVGVAADRGAVGRGRAARRRVHRAAGRQGGGRRRCSPIPTSGP